MSSTTRRRWVVVLAMVSAIGAGDSTSTSGRDRSGWPTRGGGPEGIKYSSHNQIHRGNVTDLEVAWIYRTEDERPATIECNPILIGETLFVTTSSLKVVALDASTGEEQWVYDPFEGRRARGVNRGVCAWSEGEDTRIFSTAGSDLFALDASTGKLIETFGINGRVDLREGLDQDLYFLSVSATSPGIVYKDLLIMGSRVGEGPGPAAPGHVRAYDVRTGERRWIFHTIPHPGEFGYDTWPKDAWRRTGGCNAWGGFTLDEARGLVFFGTGSPSYDHYGGDRKGANLFGNCIIALDAANGDRRWHFQTVHHDLWDYDLPCPPSLITVRREGQEIDAVAQVTKTGFLFVLDRETGEPLFDVEEVEVPSSELPGEKSWPTQPVPKAPPPYAQQRFEVTDLNEKERQEVQEAMSKIRAGELYDPPSLTETTLLPQFNGGTDWGGGAWDPLSRLFFVNASNEAESLRMVPSKPREDIRLGDLGRDLCRSLCSHCHGVETSDNVQSLRNLKERSDPKQLRELLRKGQGQMPAFAHLTEVELHALEAFFFGRGKNEKVRLSESPSWRDRIPYVDTGHRELRTKRGLPYNKGPWGTLSALDLDKGTIVWQVPLGTYPGLESTGTFNIGGPLVTAGGLVFIGAAMDERFHAFDAHSGELLWEYSMDAGGYATPSTYEIDGRQFVVIAAGGGGKPGTKVGDAFYAFALPKKGSQESKR